MTTQFQILNKILQTGDYSLVLLNNLTESYFPGYTAEFKYISLSLFPFPCTLNVCSLSSIFKSVKSIFVSSESLKPQFKKIHVIA